MTYFLIVLLWIAPFVSTASADQQKPETGVKQSAVQERTSGKQQGPDEKQAPEKPNQPAEVFNRSGTVQAPTGETEKQNAYDPRKDPLYRAYLWFTILGVLGAWAGIFVIFIQTRHISQQTEHLARQIIIQQRSSRQWVNILRWQQHPAEGMNMTIGVYFQIENPTKVPLLLDHVKCSVRGQHQDSMRNTFLAPDNPFPHEFYARLDISDWTSYSQGSGVVLEVEVSVFFADAFDNQWTQIFQKTLLCRGPNFLDVSESRTSMRRREPNQDG